MDHGYYDPWPTTPLDRSLLFLGASDAPIRRAAHALASLNGWPVTFIGDQLQHELRVDEAFLDTIATTEFFHDRCAEFVRAGLRGQPTLIALPAGWQPDSALLSGSDADLIYILAEESDLPAEQVDSRTRGVLRVERHFRASELNERLLALLTH